MKWLEKTILFFSLSHFCDLGILTLFILFVRAAKPILKVLVCLANALLSLYIICNFPLALFQLKERAFCLGLPLYTVEDLTVCTFLRLCSCSKSIFLTHPHYTKAIFLYISTDDKRLSRSAKKIHAVTPTYS